MTFIQNILFKFGLSLFIGAISILAYAPFEYSFIIFPCLAYLFYLFNTSNTAMAVRHAFAFGFAQFGVGVSWVYVSLNVFGNMPPIMAAIAVMLFVAVMALYFALMAWVFSKFKQSKASINNALIFAALWVLFETLRGFLLTGFPWLDIGYTQTTKWLSGFAPIGGIYAVSFFTALISAFLTLVYIFIKAQKLYVGLLCLMVCVISLLGGKFLTNISWSEALDRDYKIGVVQANIPIQKKWQSSFRTELVDRYRRLSPQEPLDLLILPETAMPVYRHNVSKDFWASLGTNHQGVLSGITELDPETKKIYNSAVVNCGADEQVFRKSHLVPFGEYLPLRGLFSWVLDYLQLPMSDFSAWRGQQSIQCDGVNLAVSICYEDSFALEVARNLGDGGILINISEDAWFGNSLAPHQRQQMAQMRAQETARPMVRSSNTGPSTFVDHKGHILSETPTFIEKTLVAKLQPRSGKTPFVKYSAWFIYFCGLIVFVSVSSLRYLEK